MTPPVDLAAASAFVAATGLELSEVTGTRVAGHIDVGPQHHTPWGSTQEYTAVLLRRQS